MSSLFLYFPTILSKKHAKKVVVSFLLSILPTIYCRTKGIVYLDDITFSKIVGHHDVCVVKFDNQYAYGNDGNEYQKFALRVASNNNILVAELGTTDWGEKQNHATREKYNVSVDSYPVFKLFLKNSTEAFATFPGPVTEQKLVEWIHENSNQYIGSGNIFEDLAKKFIIDFKLKNDAPSEAILKKVRGTIENADDQTIKETGGIYHNIMKKIIAKGVAYVGSEIIRVAKLTKEKLRYTKRLALEDKLRILKVFDKFIRDN